MIIYFVRVTINIIHINFSFIYYYLLLLLNPLRFPRDFHDSNKGIFYTLIDILEFPVSI